MKMDAGVRGRPPHQIWTPNHNFPHVAQLTLPNRGICCRCGAGIVNIGADNEPHYDYRI
jgi:hypothetical protein